MALSATPVLSNQIPGPVITGQVSAVSNGDWITVDGKAYRIQAGSPAASAAPKFTQGQRVDLQLNGPANTAASAVVNIVAHSGQ